MDREREGSVHPVIVDGLAALARRRMNSQRKKGLDLIYVAVFDLHWKKVECFTMDEHHVSKSLTPSGETRMGGGRMMPA